MPLTDRGVMFMMRDCTRPTETFLLARIGGISDLIHFGWLLRTLLERIVVQRTKLGAFTLHTDSADEDFVAAALYSIPPPRGASTGWPWIICFAGCLELNRTHAFPKTHFRRLDLSRLRVSQIVVVDGRIEPTFADR